MRASIPSETTHSAGPAEIEQSVVEWLRTELEDPDISGSDNFLDIGGHSLTFSRLNMHLGEKFGRTLDQETTYREELRVAVAAMRKDADPKSNS